MSLQKLHVARITDPEKYESLETKKDELGKGISAIYGTTGDETEITALYFSKSIFTPAQAKAWLKEHEYKVAKFEAAGDAPKELFRCDDVEIFRTGVWKMDAYTEKDLDAIVEAYEKTKDEIDIPLKLGHNTDQMLLQQDGYPAAGYVDSLKRIGNTLVASFRDIPKKVKDFLDTKAYNQRSAEIWWNAQVDMEVFPRFLAGVALLGADIPEVTGLGDFGKLYNKVGNKKTYEFELKEGEFREYGKKDSKIEGGKDMKTVEQLQAEIDAANAALATKDTEIKTYKKESEDTKAEKTKLEKDVADKDAALKTRLAADRTSAIKVFTAKMVEEGKLIPANVAEVESFMEALDDTKEVVFKKDDKEEKKTVRQMFESFLSGLPKIIELHKQQSEAAAAAAGKKEFKADPKLGSEVEQKLHFFTTQYLEENKLGAEKYAEALTKVKALHPELR